MLNEGMSYSEKSVMFYDDIDDIYTAYKFIKRCFFFFFSKFNKNISKRINSNIGKINITVKNYPCKYLSKTRDTI